MTPMLEDPPKQWDIIGLGCTAIDDLYYFPEFPLEDTKTRVFHYERQWGGLTGTALVTAARLGARCAFAGLLGFDELSRATEENFQREKIDISFTPHEPEARVVHANVIVAAKTGTRTIFYTVEGRVGAHETLPAESLLRDTRAIFLDQYGMTGNIRAARIARNAGIAVVADLEDDADPLFSELLVLIDHLVISEEFAKKITGARSDQTAIEQLGRKDRQAVVITCGAKGVWFAGADGAIKHQRAFQVNVVDTTGCGDVFHGAYAAALVQGKPLAECVRFASAAAALKATQPGGQRGIPTSDEVADFLSSWPPVY
jgi:sulfofructose kinase